MDDGYPTMTNDEADMALFGDVDMQGAIIARPISIQVIGADIKQPRRIFPAEIRGDWQGTAERVPSMLRQWHEMVEKYLSYKLDATKLVMGHGDSFDLSDSVMVNGYIDLCDLAATIVHDTMLNPITVQTGYGGLFVIETGERRWLAHHLLVMYGHDKFDKIAAQVVKYNAFRQAAENASRKPLNAVGVARQLALILMHMHGIDKFQSWEVCVSPGECDRNYYVQALNLSTPRGPGNRLLGLTGIKNRQMVSNYRAIMDLPDDVWQQADEEDWTESACRVVISRAEEDRKQRNYDKATANPPTPLPASDDVGGVMSSIDDITDDYDEETPEISEILPEFSVGDRVKTTKGIGIITSSMKSIYGQGKKAYWIKGEEDHNTFVCQGDDILWVKYDTGGGGAYFPHELVEVAAEADGSETHPYDGGQESGADYVDEYVPETHEDAQSVVSKTRPGLARLLVALSDYYDQCDEIGDQEIGWSLEDMLATEGAIRKEIAADDEALWSYQTDMKTARRAIRSYLEQIAGHVDELADELVGIADGFHHEYWSEDDVE